MFWAQPGTWAEFRIDNLPSYNSQVTFDWLVPPFNTGSSFHTGTSYTAKIPVDYGSGIHRVACVAVHNGVESDVCMTYLYVGTTDPTYRAATADSLVRVLNAMPKPTQDELLRQWKAQKQATTRPL